MTPEKPAKRAAARKVTQAGPGSALSPSGAAAASGASVQPAGPGAALSTSGAAVAGGVTPAGSGAAVSASGAAGAAAASSSSSNAAPASGTAGKGNAMAQFSVNPQRQDAYKNFKFRVTWDGKPVPGICRVSCLKRTTEPIEHREGGDASQLHSSPGVWKFEPIVLERGITHDPSFEDWANLSYSVGAPMSLKTFRKNIVIDLLNEQGVLVKSFKVYRCWVSEYQVLPVLDANDGAIAIESITLENEGWERDTSVTEPVET
jgi:phage tail-like protein